MNLGMLQLMNKYLLHLTLVLQAHGSSNIIRFIRVNSVNVHVYLNKITVLYLNFFYKFFEFIFDGKKILNIVFLMKVNISIELIPRKYYLFTLD